MFWDLELYIPILLRFIGSKTYIVTPYGGFPYYSPSPCGVTPRQAGTEKLAGGIPFFHENSGFSCLFLRPFLVGYNSMYNLVGAHLVGLIITLLG